MEHLKNFKIIVIQRSRSINDMDQKIRIPCKISGPVHSDLFHYITGVPDSCRIHNIQGNSLKGNVFLQYISDSAGNIGNDSPVFTQEYIQKIDAICADKARVAEFCRQHG